MIKIFILILFVACLSLIAFLVGMLIKVIADKDELEQKILEREDLEVWW